jgi:hypothetical protein
MISTPLFHRNGRNKSTGGEKCNQNLQKREQTNNPLVIVSLCCWPELPCFVIQEFRLTCSLHLLFLFLHAGDLKAKVNTLALQLNQAIFSPLSLQTTEK